MAKRPDKWERGARGRRPEQDVSTTSVHDSHDTLTVPRWTGCPCGCQTVPGLVDDPECKRHRTVSTSRECGWCRSLDLPARNGAGPCFGACFLDREVA